MKSLIAKPSTRQKTKSRKKVESTSEDNFVEDMVSNPLVLSAHPDLDTIVATQSINLCESNRREINVFLPQMDDDDECDYSVFT